MYLQKQLARQFSGVIRARGAERDDEGLRALRRDPLIESPRAV